MLKRNEGEVVEISDEIVREEGEREGKAIMERGMGLGWGSDGGYGERDGFDEGDDGVLSNPEGLERDGVVVGGGSDWKVMNGRDVSCGWKVGFGQPPSTFTSGFGSVSIMGSRHAMTGVRHSNQKSGNGSRVGSWDLSRSFPKITPLGHSAPK